MTKIRWGVLSTANIGVAKVLPAMQRGALCDVTAIASRDLSKAQATAQQLGIPKAYGSYGELLADPEIDAIYNPLPNHLHVPWSIKAIEAGKHVLCEKPMSMNAAELEVLRPFTSKVHVQEAFMVRSHPQWTAAREHVRRGEIGELRFMQVPFSYFNVDAANIRNRPDAGEVAGPLDLAVEVVSVH
jgi:predicted dehydrogenase